MQAFFQHVGEQNAARDFPRTLVADESHVLRFQFSQVERFLPLPHDEKEILRRRTAQAVPGGFQIWGIPEGARSVLNAVQEGDAFLLLRTIGDQGRFGFAGRVVAIPRCNAGEASKHFWGESRFPLLLFFDGAPSTLLWQEFRDNLGYASNWDPRGQTYRIKPEKLENSIYKDAERLLQAATQGFSEISEIGSDPLTASAITNFEANFSSPEGRRSMRQHLVRERDPNLVRAFRRKLKSFACSVCDFDFERRYGLMGTGYIEAHHTKAVGMMREGDVTDLDSLVPVCANCHRMLHRQWPPHTIEDVRQAIQSA